MRGVVDHHDGGQPQVFVGWLGLLKALQESFAAPESAGSPAQEGEL
jgi:hypothetical protein